MFKPNKTTPKYFSVEHNFLLDAFIDEHLFLSSEYSAVSFFQKMYLWVHETISSLEYAGPT